MVFVSAPLARHLLTLHMRPVAALVHLYDCANVHARLGIH